MLKSRWTYPLLALATFSLTAPIGVAATQTSSVSAEQISAQTQALEKQMQTLQTQLQQLKRQQAYLIKDSSTTTSKHTSKTSKKTASSGSASKKASSTPKKKVIQNNPNGTPGSQLTSPEYTEKWMDIRGTTVVTSPYFGPRPQFDGSDMLINTSSVNKDLVLLQMRQNIDNTLKKAGKHPQEYSVIALSGELEGSANVARSYAGSSSSDLNLTTAEIDVAALVYPWLIGYMTVEYDDSSPVGAANDAGRRESNSNIELGQGFFTVGNLNRSPFYLTIGQLYAPFGQYTSYMTSDSLPKIIGRSKVRAAVVGYNNRANTGPYASIYTFSGDSRTTQNRNIDEGGLNVGYRYTDGLLKAKGSVSVISNIADSGGMQNNGVDGADEFQGFSRSSTERIAHRVPGFDAQGNISYGAYTWIAEYTGATRDFSSNDLSFNGEGAQPMAVHTEGAYNFKFYERPASFAIGYDHSWEALGLNLPQNRIISTVSYSIWRNTLASFEFRHDMNYSSGTTAGGSIDDDQANQRLLSPSGPTSNTFTLSLDYYF